MSSSMRKWAHTGDVAVEATPTDTQRSGGPNAGCSGQRLGTYTPFEANTYILTLEQSGLKLLVDPWLVDQLIFGGQKWFFSGDKPVLAGPGAPRLADVVSGVNLLLIAQSLPDHLHKPTLQAMPDKSVPVVTGPEAAQIIRGLGFTNVTAVDHGEKVSLCEGKLEVTAVVGALVGPPWSKRQNGWILQETGEGGIRVYYEPHASHELQAVRRAGPVDVAIMPTTSSFAAGYGIVAGRSGTPEVMKVLRPRVLVPLDNDNVDYKGVLAAVLKKQGSVVPAEVEAWLASEGIEGVRVAGPQQPGKTVDIVV